MVDSCTLHYKSSLESWYEESGVRIGKRRILDAGDGISEIYFPPELAPITQHSLVTMLGQQVYRRLLVRHLYLYLDTIERLEHEIVNRVTYNVARRNCGFEIPVSMRLDAYKIYTDEAYHMLFSADLIEQIVDATGITPILAPPAYDQYVKHLNGQLGESYEELILMLLSVVTETMISSILLDIPKDRRVVETVRNLVRDHAEDEGRHARFFSHLFERVWFSLSAKDKAVMAPLLPSLISSFCCPNFRALILMLAAEGINDKVARGIIEESYPRIMLQESAHNSAQASVRLFERSGLMKDQKTAEEFEKYGLWTPR